jgi:hypothetical protein
MPSLPPTSSGSAGPTGRNPAFVRTFWDARFCSDVAAQAPLSLSQIAQLTNRRGGDTTPGRILSDSIAQYGRVLRNEDQVEAAQHRTIIVDQYVVGGNAIVLLAQQSLVSLGEVLEELIAPIGDRNSEIGTVGQLKVQHRPGVVSAQTLQLGHTSTLDAHR